MPLAEIHVTLKPALFDAQGETIKKALHQLGHASVQNVRIGKFITIEVNGTDAAALQGQLDKMCQQLLANPVIENYEITLPANFDAVPVANVAQTDVQSAPALGASLMGSPVAVVNAVPTPVSDAVGTPAPITGAMANVAATIGTPASGAVISPSSAPVSLPKPPSAGPSVSPPLEAVASPGGVTDPFTIDFRSYEAMPTEAKMALRTLALRKYGGWIEGQLRGRAAAWILCLGQDVMESGPTIDSYPSDQHLLKMGIKSDRVPWVFTKPQ